SDKSCGRIASAVHGCQPSCQGSGTASNTSFALSPNHGAGGVLPCSDIMITYESAWGDTPTTDGERWRRS
ncbi:hypothetical protein ASPCADRAFT_208417, partial [Aspergillus carbonarius ITEM 5010]